MILIVSEQLEYNVNAVCEILSHRKVPWFRWNGEDMLGNLRMSFECRNGSRASGRLSLLGKDLQLPDVRAVWNRRRGVTTELPTLTKGQNAFIQRECDNMRSGLFELLDHAAWMNDPLADRRAHNKLFQLQQASALGLRIPPTLVTQDPDKAVAFYQTLDQQVLCKCISPSAEVQGDAHRGPGLIYANKLRAGLSREDFESIRIAPTLLQGYVEKDYELRVTVVGRSVFAAAIDSQNSPIASVDSRRYDFQNTPYSPYRLPQNLETCLLALMNMLGLVFGAVDLIRSKDGTYTFLEVNPGGQWGWVEGLTGLPITEAVATWLIHESGAA